MEVIRRAATDSVEAVDRLARLVEFMPASEENALRLLSILFRDLTALDVLGVDYYNYHEKSINLIIPRGWGV